MEVKKYNLERSQTEAARLKQKVESGEATEYAEAEEIVEREITEEALQPVRDLIKTSDDLERFGLFVKRLSEGGFDAKKIIYGATNSYDKSDWTEAPLFGRGDVEETVYSRKQQKQIDNPALVRYKEWQEILSDSEKLDQALSVMEAAFTHGADPREFVSGIGLRFIKEGTPEELEKLKGFLTSLADKAMDTFGSDYYGKSVVTQVFKSLNYEKFASHIKTPEDFGRYANCVLEVVRLHLKTDKEGKVDGQYEAQNVAGTVADMTYLDRDDFDRDLETMLQMMRDNPSPKEKETIFGALKNIRDLIKTSDDLERFGLFVKRLSEGGFDAKKIIYGATNSYDKSDWTEAPLFGRGDVEETVYSRKQQKQIDNPALVRYKEWQEILSDSEKLDQALSVMEAAFTHGADPREFVSGIGLRFIKEGTPEELEKLKGFLTSLADKAMDTFGSDYYGKSVVTQVFKSLNYEKFASHIKTPEDFGRYANCVLEVVRLHLKTDKEGKVDGQYEAQNVAGTVADMTYLDRDDFDRDLETMLQMMRDNPSPKEKETIFGALKNIRDLIKTSDDLERFGLFVKRLSEGGFDAKKVLFGNDTGYTNRFNPLFGRQDADETVYDRDLGKQVDNPVLVRFKEWQEILSDSDKLDQALSVMEAAFTHGADPREFVNGAVGRKLIQEGTPEELEKLKQQLSTIADEVETFGGYYKKEIITKIFKSLNYGKFADRIQTPEDFGRYANCVLEVVRLHLKTDKEGKVDGQYEAQNVAGTVADMTYLDRDDFDRDLETMLQMMRDNPSPKEKETIFGALKNIRDLIKTSDDLERFGLFVKRLSEGGFDAKKVLFGNDTGYTNRFNPLFGRQDADETVYDRDLGKQVDNPVLVRFKEWQEILSDSDKLDQALSVMEAAFTHGADPREFVNGAVGRKLIQEGTPEELEKLKQQLSTIADEVETFGGYYKKEIITKIFKSLNYGKFADRIQTPEDFGRYANCVLEVVRLHLKTDKEGKVDGQYEAQNVAGTVADMTYLDRDDFDRDLETMLQMMRDNPSPKEKETIFGALKNIRDLIKTSDDLERFGLFVKRLSEGGFDAKKVLFGNDTGYTNRFNPLFGRQDADETVYDRDLGKQVDNPVLVRFKEWQEILSDSDKLDQALSVMEAAFTHGADPREFVNKINLLSQNEREEFMPLAQEFIAKNIPPQFVLDNLPLLKDCDFSQDGLAIFTTFEAQEKWLGYCVDIWKKSPQSVEGTAKFFNEAFSLRIKTEMEYSMSNVQGIPPDEWADIQEEVEEGRKDNTKPNKQLRDSASEILRSALSDLYENKNFEAISSLSDYIDNPGYRREISLMALSALTFERADFEHSIDFEKLDESDYAEAFEFAKQHSSEWQDEQTISGPFQAGAETFGYKRMLEYIKRDELSLHDALHAFREIMELFRGSGLSEAEFYGQILQQVNMDDREYSEGTAHHHLNTIAQTVNRDVSGVIEKVKEYKDIERLQELAATFDSPQAVFTSWSNLKRYSELEQLLGRTEVFDELQELKAEGKQALYHYVETLAFHPDSKVNMSSVIEFWRYPEHFLAAEASHTPYEVHDRKKPSNYINMPNLDLTASELRDALVEGKMDGLSVFTPLEIKYTIPVEDYVAEPLPELVNKALGSRKKGIEGAARNPKKLFSELNNLFKSKGGKLIDYIQGKDFPEGISIPEQQIESLVYDSDFGMEKPLIKTREFVARISQKSDPEGAIAGDDTVNCMPFGDGKNTLYTFNPNTAQFVIRIVKGDGKERTIAQSVLTKDMDIQAPIPDILQKMKQEGGHLEDILPESILSKASVYAACDNVEVAPNYSDERHQQIIEAIFRDFFREYMSRYSEKEGLNSKKVPIGQGYTDALSQLPTEKNTFAPQAPVSYSDKTGENVYMLDLTKEEGLDLIISKQVRELEVEKNPEPSLPNIKGLEYLTYEDTLKVGYLEGKAYSDNQSLMQFLFDVENGLIAKDINNSAKERPNMSLKYTDEGGKMSGYLLAWEGRLNDENIEQDVGELFDQPCVYIIDVAADGENRMAGGRLIKGFAELYKQNYIDNQQPLPIYAQAREKTSYQIVKRQLDKLGKSNGITFELVELPTYEVGEDTMHPIIIRPVVPSKK